MVPLSVVGGLGIGHELDECPHWSLPLQVHPLVARLCGPIEGTDPARLADCLGLESAKFHSATNAVEESREDPFASTVTLDDESRFQVHFRPFQRASSLSPGK